MSLDQVCVSVLFAATVQPILVTTFEKRPPVHSNHFQIPHEKSIYNLPRNSDHLFTTTSGQAKRFPNAHFALGQPC